MNRDREQFRFLVGHFFGRLFDNEIVTATRAEMHVTLTQVLVVLSLPGLVASLYLFPKYGFLLYRPLAERDLATLPDKSAFLFMSMAMLGLLTVLEWDALFPDRWDYSILTPLPIRVRTLFAAKVTALLAFLLIFTAALNVCPTVLFPLAVLAKNAALSTAGRYVASHAASVLAANAFVFLSFITIQGVLLSLLGERVFRRLSRLIRFALFFTLLTALLLLPGIVDSFEVLRRRGDPFIYIFPPMWFLGLYETLLGTGDPVFQSLAAVSRSAVILSGSGFALAYGLSYRRHLRGSLEAPEGNPEEIWRLKSLCFSVLNSILVQNPTQRATFYFTLRTLFRSRKHSLYFSAFFGAGTALILMSLIGIIYGHSHSVIRQLDRALLSIPLVFSFFVLVGLRIIFTIPAELESNWIFRLADSGEGDRQVAGVRKAMLAVLALPLVFLAAPFYLMLWDWPMVFLHLAYGVVMSCLLLELLLFRFNKIPFTCSYLPGKANLKLLWPVYIFGFTTYAYSFSTLEAGLLRDAVRFATFFCIAIGILISLGIYRCLKTRAFVPVYEEHPDDVPRILSLQE